MIFNYKYDGLPNNETDFRSIVQKDSLRFAYLEARSLTVAVIGLIVISRIHPFKDRALPCLSVCP